MMPREQASSSPIIIISSSMNGFDDETQTAARSIQNLDAAMFRDVVCSFLDEKDLAQLDTICELSERFELHKCFCDIHGTKLQFNIKSINISSSSATTLDVPSPKQPAAALLHPNPNPKELSSVLLLLPETKNHNPHCLDCHMARRGCKRCQECQVFSSRDSFEHCGHCGKDSCHKCSWFCCPFCQVKSWCFLLRLILMDLMGVDVMQVKDHDPNTASDFGVFLRLDYTVSVLVCNFFVLYSIGDCLIQARTCVESVATIAAT
jgi:hypothetical protein